MPYELFIWISVGACIILIGLTLDGVIPIPLQRLAHFPFKGLPATNGALLAFIILACSALVGWVAGLKPFQ